MPKCRCFFCDDDLMIVQVIISFASWINLQPKQSASGLGDLSQYLQIVRVWLEYVEAIGHCYAELCHRCVFGRGRLGAYDRVFGQLSHGIRCLFGHEIHHRDACQLYWLFGRELANLAVLD